MRVNCQAPALKVPAVRVTESCSYLRESLLALHAARCCSSLGPVVPCYPPDLMLLCVEVSELHILSF
jgi:hypothetical protein